MVVRKRGTETSEKVIGLTPPTEAWLLRKLAEIRREQEHDDKPVARPAKRYGGKR